LELTERQRQVLDYLARAGEARISEAAKALGAGEAGLKDLLTRLKARGLVESTPRRTWKLTGEGFRTLKGFGKKASSLGALPAWASLLALLPTPEYRALLRLTLAVAYLRQKAPSLGPMPWLGAYGPPGTGKSTVGEVALALVGGRFFDVRAMTPGEALGRRRQIPGGGWEVEPPATLAGPITVLDELGEAPSELQRALFALVNDRPQVVIEGQELPHRAAIYATWNPEGREVPLPEGAKRRGLVLNTALYARTLHKAFVREGVGERIRELLEALPSPWLDLAQAPSPSPEGVDPGPLREALYGLLTPRGRGEVPLGALRPLAVAYKALFFPEDAEGALVEATYDMALVLASRPGLLVPGWERTLQALRGGLTLEEPSRPEEGRGYRALMEERGRRNRLSTKLKRLLREAYRYRALTPEEEEERADLRGRVEVLVGELEREASPLEALEADGEALAQAFEAFLGRVKHRLEVEKARLLEEAKNLKAQAQEAWNLAQRIRALAYKDPEEGMRELEKRGMVKRAAPQALPSGPREEGESALRVLQGVLGAALVVAGRPEGWRVLAGAVMPQVVEAGRGMATAWEFRGEVVKDPSTFLSRMAQHLEKWAGKLSQQADSLRLRAKA